MKIVAEKSMSYAGRRLSPGDEFDAPYGDARVLVAIGKAGWYIAPRAAPQPPQVEPVPVAQPEVAKPASTYRTRRMKAGD